MSEVIKLTPKLWVRRSEHWENYYVWCPGCNELHGFRTRAPQPRSGEPSIPSWTYNGNPEKPTFTPSLRYLRHRADYPGCGPHCHIIVTDGKLQFCADCEHKLAGTTIDLLPIILPDDYMIA